MEFRIADTFTGSMARLTNDEQKLVKTTAFDLQMNPASPGMQFHKLDRAKDKNFWSVRAGSDIRLIVHKTAASLLLCYVGHHDDAYGWAERRKIERHPTTGAAQLVEIRERVQEIVLPTYVEPARLTLETKLLFRSVSDEQLLGYGVPAEWLADVKRATEDSLFDLAEHLPPEAAEALLNVATGSTPTVPLAIAPSADPFSHPNARQRFRLMTNVEELERALNSPWERWSVFLHPAQEELVRRQFNGPARVQGSAGTGKTVVALHRAAFLARSNANALVLLTTFTDTLASELQSKLRVLVTGEPEVAKRINVRSLDAVGVELYSRGSRSTAVATPEAIQQMIADAAKKHAAHKFTRNFLWHEWNDVVDACQITSWDAYRDVSRLGRKTKLGEKQRQSVWEILTDVSETLASRGLITMAQIFTLVSQRKTPEFDFAVVDEAQDISIQQLKFLSSIVRSNSNSLFFAGDLGQRIFQIPFSWKAIGVDIRGRSRSLKINYRTSHQIRRQADKLLHRPLVDVDGVADESGQAISVFNGLEPEIKIVKDSEAEGAAIASWLRNRLKEGVSPIEIAVFVRSEHELPRANRAVVIAGLAARSLSDSPAISSPAVLVTTMHAAKGLEFRCVAIAACDDGTIPLQERIESVSDTADLEEVYATERHLLYVACTRARDNLLITAVGPGSEFLDDMK